MSGGTITLIVNLLLLLFVLVGFLIGVTRGALKQGVRMLYFVGVLVVIVLVTPLISDACTTIQINGQSLDSLISNAITNNEQVKAFVDANPTMNELIEKLPLIVINLAVFIVGVLVALLVSGIAYIITKHIHLNKYKREQKKLEKTYITNQNIPQKPNGVVQEKKPPETQICVMKDGKPTVINASQAQNKIYTVKNGKPVVITKPAQKSKRYRWWGGLIGAVSGFVVMFVLLLPITGLARTVNSYIDPQYSSTSQVSADDGQNTFEYAELSKQITDVVGEEYIGYLQGFTNSIFVKTGGVFNLDLLCFDTISTVKVGDEKITLRKEVNAVAQVTESVLYVSALVDATSNTSWQNVDFDKLEKAINALFSSGIIKSAGTEILTNYLNKLTNPNDAIYAGADEQTVKYAVEIFSQLKASYDNASGDMLVELKNDLLAVLNVAKAVCYSGIMAYLTNIDGFVFDEGQTEFDYIKACLFGKSANSKEQNHDYLADISTSLFQSSSLKGALVGAINVAVSEFNTAWAEELEKEGENLTQNPVNIETLTQTKINWTNIANSFEEIITYGLDIYEYYQDEILPYENQGLSDDEYTKAVLGNQKIATLLSSVGKLLNKLSDLEILKGTTSGTSIYDQLLTQVNRLDAINKYINLTVLSEANYEDELKLVGEYLTFARPLFNTNDYQNFNYAGLNWNSLKTADATGKNNTEKLFSGVVAELLKLDWIKEEINYNNLTEDEQAIFDAFFGTGENQVKKLSDLGDSGCAYLYTIYELAKGGTINFIAQNSDNEVTVAELKAFLENLTSTEQNATSTYLQSACGYLFGDTRVQNLLQTAFNQYVVPELQNMGITVEKLNNVKALANEKDKIAEALTSLVEVFSDVNIASFDDVKDINGIIEAIVNDKLPGTNGNAFKLGKALDEILSCQAFNTANCNALQQILKQELEKTEMFEYDTSVANFWQTELPKIANALIILRENTVDGTQNSDTMLKALLAGRTDDVINGNGLKNMSETDIKTISDTLCDSKLLRPISEKLLNQLNKKIVSIVDSSYNTDVVNKNTNLTSQKTQIANVLIAGLKVLDIDLSSTDSLLNNSKNKTKVKALLVALKANADADGIFKDAYTALNTKFYDLVNDANKEILSVVGATETNIPTFDIAQQFDTIMDIMEKANEIKDLDLNSVDSLLGDATTQAKVKALLSALQTNASESGIFTSAFNAFNTKFYTAVNDASKKIMGYVGATETNIAQFDIVAQFDNIMTTLEKAKAVADTGKTTLEDMIKATSSKNKLETLVINLQASYNANQNYAFNDAYNAIYNYVKNTNDYANFTALQGKDKTNVVWGDLLDEIADFLG